ncbi:tRNA uridine-5-carboxymethylaminomethyl(34) synthesis GTPase MnmE [Thalassobaculum sp.]|uniref:tRNA uridine-5-carboxymethylaminomethyl(34) synthesis GTPase MnmE n=1 Tax=Thalassobaculum sp. TaxID=2022740 RepID=UPI0032EC2D54
MVEDLPVNATDDTIAALATAPGRAGIAVLRISGPAAAAAVRALAGRLPEPRRLSRARLRDPDTGETLDDALMVLFPGPASFTGEDVAELHLHGGRAVTAAVLGAVLRRPGVRPAEPGEFTRRAFLNDRIDLTAAEGILDLVDAETDAQRRQALRQAGGGLAAVTEAWRAGLVAAMARLEAWIDFPDEDLPAEVVGAVLDGLDGLAAALDGHLADAGRGERLREGLRMAIVGPPNAGKSSLLNWLAKRDVAIVSATAGTTRDVLEIYLDVNGYPATVADTAGLRETADSVELEGVRRALARAEEADLRLVVVDWGAGEGDRAAVARWLDADAIAVANKIDRGGEPPEPWIPVSVTTGQGLETLLARIGAELEARMGLREAPALTRARHRSAAEEARTAVRRAAEGLRGSLPLELPAEDLRLAARALGRITGKVDVEEILDAIFREFCLGK